MAEQLRNEDKVCAAVEEGHREGVPTGVGGDLIIETASDDDGSEDAAGGAVESLPPRRQQQFLGSAARVTGW
jgi:hypothetical protein